MAAPTVSAAAAGSGAVAGGGAAATVSAAAAGSARPGRRCMSSIVLQCALVLHRVDRSLCTAAAQLMYFERNF